MKIVAYHRVSTARQGRSGLGLDAQEKAIQDYAKAKDATIVGTFTEVESGKNNDRPELTKALHLAKVTGATLVIAKLDRLSRNAATRICATCSARRISPIFTPQTRTSCMTCRLPLCSCSTATSRKKSITSRCMRRSLVPGC